ncbi:hypothetical protein [Loigolactobacillus zhaoyuanensis]|uniref:Uncharacterized protein n=1 Tax=Loigolactobacillus zhaoyuanensis TaxID=2486017 RepID=A0ABW8U9F1_9LACO
MQENDEILNPLAVNTAVNYLCQQRQTDPLAAIAKLITAVAAYRIEKFVDDRDLYQASVCYADLTAGERRIVRERYLAYVQQAQRSSVDHDHCSAGGLN